MSRFLNVHFLLKFVAFILNLVALIIYHVMEVEHIFSLFNKYSSFLYYDYNDPTYRDLTMSRRILYAHTIPPYLIIMFVFVALYIVNKPPGNLMCKVFLVVGAILTFALAVLIFVLYSKYHSKTNDYFRNRPNYFTGSLTVGIISIINCLIYITDFVLYFVKNFD